MCQPKYLPEPPAPRRNDEAESKSRAVLSTNRTRAITLEELQENFHLPINDVACKLGVCVTVLKQQCRELGIMRWPYRKVRKLDNMLSALESSNLEKASRPFSFANGEEERQKKIVAVKQTLSELLNNPNSSSHLKLGKMKYTKPRGDGGPKLAPEQLPHGTPSMSPSEAAAAPAATAAAAAAVSAFMAPSATSASADAMDKQVARLLLQQHQQQQQQLQHFFQYGEDSSLLLQQQLQHSQGSAALATLFPGSLGSSLPGSEMDSGSVQMRSQLFERVSSDEAGAVDHHASHSSASLMLSQPPHWRSASSLTDMRVSSCGSHEAETVRSDLGDAEPGQQAAAADCSVRGGSGAVVELDLLSRLEQKEPCTEMGDARADCAEDVSAAAKGEEGTDESSGVKAGLISGAAALELVPEEASRKRKRDEEDTFDVLSSDLKRLREFGAVAPFHHGTSAAAAAMAVASASEPQPAGSLVQTVVKRLAEVPSTAPAGIHSAAAHAAGGISAANSSLPLMNPPVFAAMQRQEQQLLQQWQLQQQQLASMYSQQHNGRLLAAALQGVLPGDLTTLPASFPASQQDSSPTNVGQLCQTNIWAAARSAAAAAAAAAAGNNRQAAAAIGMPSGAPIGAQGGVLPSTLALPIDAMVGSPLGLAASASQLAQFSGLVSRANGMYGLASLR